MAKTYKTSVLSVFDENGNKIEIPALRGKSAYEYAKDDGYAGSEVDFAKDINPDNIKSDIPTKTSELTNDSNYITNAVIDLTNYYLKSETYTQNEINALVSAIPKFSIEVVISLPTANISNTTVYLVKSSDETSNLYDEYIYVNNAWEHLGSQTVDVSNKMDKVTGGTTNNFIALDANGNARDSSYNSASFVPMSAFSGVIVPHMNDTIKHITANERAAWNAKSNFDGNYNNLTNKPTIPTNISQLTNDSGYITSSDLEDTNAVCYTAQKPTSSEQAQARANIGAISKSDIPVKVSAFTNDAGYIKNTELNSAVDAALAEAKESGEFDGKSGVYLGSGDMPSDCNVQIDPDGDVATLEEIARLAISSADISLGIASDGLIYVFVNGNPVGTGVPQGAGGEQGDLFGYIDENNTVVLKGDLAEGTYSIKYEMDDGEIVNIGNLVLDSTVYYSVTSNLTNCTSNNSTKQVAQGSSYSATITANNGYELKSVTVTMGGSPVSVSGGVINIASVTGDIVITAVAEEAVVAEPTNFAEPNTTNTTDWSIWCNNARFGSDGAYRANSGTVVTNYIPMQVGDTLYFEGLSVSTTGTAMTNGLSFYDSSKASICPTYLAWFLDDTSSAGGEYANVEVVDGAYTFELLDTFNSYQSSGKPAGSQTAYVRICGALTGTVDDVVIKVKRNGEWL